VGAGGATAGDGDGDGDGDEYAALELGAFLGLLQAPSQQAGT
jgi:hypothetical protein